MRKIFEQAFRLHFAGREQIAQLRHALGRVPQDRRHRRLEYFHHFTISIRLDCCGAPFSCQEGHFAKAIAFRQIRDLDARTIFRDGNAGRSPQENKHRVAFLAFLDDMFAPPEMIESRLVDEAFQLLVGKTTENRIVAQDLARFLVPVFPDLPVRRGTFRVRIGNGIVIRCRFSSYQTLVRTESLVSLIRAWFPM